MVQKLSRDYELISAAHHEAGHTICGLLSFIKVHAAGVNSLLKSAEDIGCTDYETIEGSFQDPEIIRFLQLSEIRLNYAGMVSERIFYKGICGADKLPMMLREGCSEDIEKAAKLIKKHDLAPAGRKRWLFKQKIMRAIRQNLEEHWEAVRLIAHALYKRKRLNFDDLRELLTKKLKNRDFWKKQFAKINSLYDRALPLDEEKIRATILIP